MIIFHRPRMRQLWQVFVCMCIVHLNVFVDAVAWSTTHRGMGSTSSRERSISRDIHSLHHTNIGRTVRSEVSSTLDMYASLITVNPLVAQQLKPQFHIRPPMGWVNDPNGPLEYPKGTYHLFFQYNPTSSNWVCDRDGWCSMCWIIMVHVVGHTCVSKPQLVPHIGAWFHVHASLQSASPPLVLYTVDIQHLVTITAPCQHHSSPLRITGCAILGACGIK